MKTYPPVFRLSAIKIDWSTWNHLLGTMPDSRLANQIGCTRSIVAHQRRQQGIPASGRAPIIPASEIDWSAWDRLLGTMPDATLARGIGCRVEALRKRRHAQCIPAFDATQDVEFATRFATADDATSELLTEVRAMWHETDIEGVLYAKERR